MTERLSKFVAETGFDDLPQTAVERAKHHILDCLGVMLAGSQHPQAKLILDHVRSLGGNPRAGVVGSGFRTSAPQAAYANGTSGHVLDFDDDSDTMIAHPSVTVLPAVMALGESASLGRDLLTAYIIGLEICARVALGPGFMPVHYERGWHATSTLGVLGAAAGGAKILELDSFQIGSAIGMAVSEAGGLKSNFGTMIKPLHAGSAAAKGVTSAMLARAGVTANPNILEGPQGFYDLYGGLTTIDESAILDGLGKDFEIVTPGINLKKYPCCYFTHSAVDALLFLVEKHGLSWDQVRKIRCGIPQMACNVLTYHMPVNATEARFSLPFCLSSTLLNGRLGIDDFDDEKVRQTKIREKMKMVDVTVEPSLNKPGIALGARLTITTADGQSYTHELEKPQGSAENPLPWEAVVSKFRTCATPILDDREANKIVQFVEQLEQLQSIREMVNILSRMC